MSDPPGRLFPRLASEPVRRAHDPRNPNSSRMRPMSEKIVIPDDIAVEIFNMSRDGESSRKICHWYKLKTKKTISHTTMLDLIHEMKVEERETMRAHDRDKARPLTDLE